MRTIITTLLLLFSISLFAQKGYDLQKRFQVKSGHVVYELTGTVTGSKEIWFDDFGKKYREEVNSEEVVKTRKKSEIVKNHSLNISDGTYYYTVNLFTNEGTKMHKDAVPDFSILGSGMNDGEMEKLGEGLMNMFGGKVEKKSEQVLGRTCDVAKIAGATVWSYKGVPLKSTAKIRSVLMNETAVEFGENIKVSASMFTPPSDAKIEDVSAQMSGNEDFNAELEEEEEQGLMFPSGVSKEQFKTESERVRRELGYSFAMHDASSGQYSCLATKDESHMFAMSAFSLKNYSGWEEMYAETGFSYFTLNGKRMGYRQSSEKDEDGKITQSSSLFVEYKGKDMLLQITVIPAVSKEEMIKIFSKIKF